jgi:hypothetical protein
MEFIFIITAIEDFIQGNISFEKFKEESDKNYEYYCNQGEEDVFLNLIDEPLLCIDKNVTDDIYDEKWGMCASFFKENY